MEDCASVELVETIGLIIDEYVSAERE